MSCIKERSVIENTYGLDALRGVMDRAEPTPMKAWDGDWDNWGDGSEHADGEGTHDN
jgi:hypothetical protein